MENPFKEAEKARKKAPGSKQEAPEKKEEIAKENLPRQKSPQKRLQSLLRPK